MQYGLSPAFDEAFEIFDDGFQETASAVVVVVVIFFVLSGGLAAGSGGLLVFVFWFGFLFLGGTVVEQVLTDVQG